MPRKDRSFTDRDVIRIIRNNLTDVELAKVLLEICKGVKIEVFDGEAILVPLTSDEETIEETSLVEGLIDTFVFRDVGAIIDLFASIFD